MKFISNLSTHVFVIIIKSQEKIKPVKWSFLNFNLNGQNFTESKKSRFYVNFQQYVQFTEFCSAHAKILMILCKLTVWLISILFSIAFHWLVTTFGIV